MHRYTLKVADLFLLDTGICGFLSLENESRKVKYLGNSTINNVGVMFKFKVLNPKWKDAGEVNLLQANYSRSWSFQVSSLDKTQRLKQLYLELLVSPELEDSRSINYPLTMSSVSFITTHTLYTYNLHQFDSGETKYTEVKKYTVCRCQADPAKNQFICNIIGSFNPFDFESQKRPLVLQTDKYLLNWCLLKSKD